MATVNVDLNARILTAQRRGAALYRCTECALYFPSETSWWKHVGDVHADLLAEFTTEEALDQFRSSRREECRIHRTSVFFFFVFCCFFNASSQIRGYVNTRSPIRKVFRRIRTEPNQYEKPAESPHHQGPTSPAARPSRRGITRGIETLRLEKQQTEATRIPEGEVAVTDAPASPTAIHRQVYDQEQGNRRSRAAPQKGGKSGSSNTGVHIFCPCVLQC